MRISDIIVGFYQFWHGRLRLKGAGRLINLLAPRLSSLQNHPFRLPNGKVVEIDFREQSSFFWLNNALGDPHQEDALIAAILRHLHPGQVFWDVGANAGILSFEISKLVKLGEHHFFEPNPKVFPWVEGALSHLENVTGHPLALSDERGIAHLYVPKKGSAFGSLHDNGQTDLEEIQINKTTGDVLVFEEGFLPPRVIKIDTEGHEVEVLAGMKQLISSHRPVVFFEHIEIGDEEVFSLVPDGYRLQTVSNVDGSLTNSFDRSAGHNSVLIPEQ